MKPEHDFSLQFEEASTLFRQGDLHAAESRYRLILHESPQHPRALQGLGVVLFQMGLHAQGIRLLREVVESTPEFSSGWLNLAIMLRKSEEIEGALDVFHRAVERNDASDVAETNLGWFLLRQGDLNAARAHLERALLYNATNADALFLLGVAQGRGGDLDGAVTSFSRLTVLCDGSGEAWCNLGYYLHEAGRLGEAHGALQRSLRCDPNVAETWNNLGILKLSFGQVRGAIRSFRRALALNPSLRVARSNLLLAMHYRAGLSQESLLAESRVWDTCTPPSREISRPNTVRCEGDRRLRIGFVSSDLRSHPVAMFLEPFFRAYDRGRLEIFCYADVAHGDEVTERLQGLVDKWDFISGMSSVDVAEKIHSEGIEILFDLGGHTSSELLGVFRHKPAPIQVSWLGYPGTSGLSQIDFRISDAIADPIGLTDRYYFEKLIRLAGGFLCFSPPANAPEIRATTQENDTITFGCFNNMAKVSSEALQLWIKILSAAPGSRLLLKNRSFGEREGRERFERRFRRLGGDPARLVLRGQTARYDEHLAMYNMVDVVLDTFPYNGTTTTCEALLMGVPVITLAGDRHVSRVSASILSRMGMEHCIATTADEYVTNALRIARGNTLRDTERLELRRAFLASPLCDAERFARDMEDAIGEMWREASANPLKGEGGGPSPDELHRIGLDSLTAGIYADAEKSFRAALASGYESAEVWSDLGIAVFNQERRSEAINYFRNAVDIDPEYAKGWSNLGNALYQCGMNSEAVEACSKAVQLQGDLYEARYNLGMSLLSCGNYGDAAKCLLEATALKPKSIEVWIHAGDACRDAGQLSRAASCYRRALMAAPNNAILLAKLGEVLLGMASQGQSERLFKRALAAGLEDSVTLSALLMSLQYLVDTPQTRFSAEAERWCRICAPAMPWLGPAPDGRERALRIGFVSADLHRHPVGVFISPFLRHYNRESFFVVCYSNSFREDEMAAEMKKQVDGWRVIAGQADREVAEAIKYDRIDILVDLSGHTAGNRLPLFALKPAPVQVSFLGYSHTTGLDAIDYVLSDSDTVLHGEECLYAERIIRLSHSRFCYQAPKFVPDVDELPALQNRRITFGCFNNPAKINESVISLWSEVLRNVPDSVLVLKWKTFENGHVKRRFLKLFARYGVGGTRIEFRGSSPHFLMMAEYGDIDIALDPFPFTGGISTCEALWMGVPVITLPSETPISRQTASFLKLVGLSRLVAASGREYVRIAVETAGDRQALARLRSGLRERMACSPLCDAQRYVGELETVFRDMWSMACAGQVGGTDADAPLNSALETAFSLFKLGRWDKAEERYLTILMWRPENSRALHGLGLVLDSRGDREKAISCLRRALELDPANAEACFNLGNMLKQCDRLDDAELNFRNSIRLKPDEAGPMTNLGGVLWSQGRIDEALPLFQRSYALAPDMDAARTGLLLSLNYSHERTPEEIFAEHAGWGGSLEGRTRQFRNWSNDRDENRILRVGYVSADFGQHPVGFFMINPIRNRNTSRIMVLCYSNRTMDDEITKYFREQADVWRDIHGIGDDAVCRMIRTDRVDILVDLSGHTGGNRLALFARKPAPIQVSWLGYPNTTGLRRIDYRFTDAIVDPHGPSDALHTEELVRLPSGFLCFFPPPDSPEVEALPSARRGFVTFGSFNNLAKITPRVISVWSRVMLALPGSRFIMKRSSFRDAATVERYRGMFVENDIEPDRVDLIPSTDTHNEHLKIYNSIDIALDSFPYNGTTTTCEALWMGVPVVALAGDRHAGRVGMSLLQRVALDEFVAVNENDYVAKSVALARNGEKLAHLREFLRDRMSASSLCNGPAFCLTLENAYREMWKKWCRSSQGRDGRSGSSAVKRVGVRRLNIGGIHRKKSWEIFNAVPAEFVDHVGDAADLSRFADATFSQIYASHVLMHFDYQYLPNKVLVEWLRVLEPGGILYVSVPDMDRLVEMWGDSEHASYKDRIDIMQMIFGSHQDACDYHYSGLNEAMLSNFLADAGFVDIRRVDDFCMFKDKSTMEYNGKATSLNMTARKATIGRSVDAISD
jgi:predicted O-linked N-acetylglucosamine transferase (SPINDLY family)/predicted SAM-dependent methyltransferase